MTLSTFALAKDYLSHFQSVLKPPVCSTKMETADGRLDEPNRRKDNQMKFYFVDVINLPPFLYVPTFRGAAASTP